MSLSDRYLLVSHGSRDRRPGEELQRLAWLVSEKIPEAEVGTAVLECHPQPLHRQLLDFLDRSPFSGGVVYVVPLFLLAGVHVKDDIPEEIALARRQLGGNGSIELLPHIGSSPDMRSLLYRRMATWEAVEAWVLMSHGSRRPGGNEGVNGMARQLQQRLEMSVSPAYWSVSPDLATQIARLSETGVRSIGIFPYFLFSGGLTDAIAENVEQLRDRFDEMQLFLTPPIGTTPDLAELVLQQILLPSRF
ncbi:sirohydrochlorin chelatase [Baaleninema sp.]|uniref:sirohydrochlorin chelatase n=1 Tax=Baaleninema sp. TaxID=3101197 RepID=UPI003D009A2D